MRSLSEAQPSLGGAGWGVARREPRALARVPTTGPRLAVDSAHALRAFGATPPPASARLTPFPKASHPSPRQGGRGVLFGSPCAYAIDLRVGGGNCSERVERHMRLPCNLGEVREGEAAFRCETIIARFPHPNPPPLWGRGSLRDSAYTIALGHG